MAPDAQRKRATSTSSFGVSRRENHDASGFYARFTAPTLSEDDTVEHRPTTHADRHNERFISGSANSV